MFKRIISECGGFHGPLWQPQIYNEFDMKWLLVVLVDTILGTKILTDQNPNLESFFTKYLHKKHRSRQFSYALEISLVFHSHIVVKIISNLYLIIFIKYYFTYFFIEISGMISWICWVFGICVGERSLRKSYVVSTAFHGMMKTVMKTVWFDWSKLSHQYSLYTVTQILI